MTKIKEMTELHRMLGEWNNTSCPFPGHLCAHQMFEARVAASPNAVAATFGDLHLSYADLNSRANRLARFLRAEGVGPEVIVAICMEGSLELLVAIFGVLKAGGAYLPLDPTYPRERLAFMVEDAKVEFILTQEHLREMIEGLRDARLVSLDVEEQKMGELADENLAVEITPRNACYVIYTSGSTGRPKGIVIEHRSLVNLVTGLGKVFEMGEGRRVLQIASFSFDASVREIFETLLMGATLCLVRREELMPGEPLLGTLQKKEITDATLVPSILPYLPYADLPDLTILSVGGEVCPESLVNRWGKGRRFFNIYGPSETTFSSSIGECQPHGGRPTIGKPLSNVRCYIVDQQMQPCAVGVAGELLIGGIGLARGYLGRPDLTAERFVPDPFSGDSGAQLYRTGDLARWLPDGELDYIGRTDQQVKVRGYRIELEEIEAVLLEHGQVSAAAVACVGVPGGEEQLVAYIVWKEGGEKEEELRVYLSERLPEYMVPGLMVEMERMPLTLAGKVNRRMLPSPAEVRRRQKYVGPRSEVERVMAGIWKEVFGVEQVSIHDNFFELGGTSILAIKLMAIIEDKFKIKAQFATLYRQPIMSELVRSLDESINKARVLSGAELGLLKEDLSAEMPNIACSPEAHS